MKNWTAKKRWARRLLASCLVGLTAGTLAEDIDLFLGPPTAATGAPSVLFVLDNSTNWESIFDDWKEGLEIVFNAMPADQVLTSGLLFA